MPCYRRSYLQPPAALSVLQREMRVSCRLCFCPRSRERLTNPVTKGLPATRGLRASNDTQPTQSLLRLGPNRFEDVRFRHDVSMGGMSGTP